MLEQGRNMRSPCPEEQGAAETTCDELTTTPFPILLHCLGAGGREIGSEVGPGKKVGRRCF